MALKIIVALVLLVGCRETPTAKCHSAGGEMRPVQGSCVTYRERTATQPRFCNDNDSDPARHCFAFVERCEWRCVTPARPPE